MERGGGWGVTEDKGEGSRGRRKGDTLWQKFQAGGKLHLSSE